jgi:hypothetical protein
LVGSPIESLNGQKQSGKNKMKVLHGTWSCSLSKINKGKIKIIVIPLCKHIVLMCFEGVAKSFENLKYVKPLI